ncbi:unnamed protein product [Rotaria sp. Silwood2]|nr:unnamed protein product [Rotaria sp. Silwood2]CAF3113080.1 unnamed protein product [Rotaria sp. Silwood2]CAF3243680.1 unnamed protein product [Rotaria sp. Silwood2]CAF3963014.1 unnamed protein product [Rotaria sp. Silwood2]CAF4089529.1 unnamed protein product [Rotaria sp. Silwood2]
MIDILNDTINQYPSLTVDGSYCKLYELRLKDLVAYNRYRREQEVQFVREKLIEDQSIDNCLSEQQLRKEFINQRQERTKLQSQEILPNNYKKRPIYIPVKTKQTITLSITSNNVPTITEPRSKCTVKTKLPPIPRKRERITSAPTSCPKNINKPKIIPTITIDYADETLSKANNHSFTQVTSSSQNYHNKRHNHARQSTLETIMGHLDSYKSVNFSKGSIYQDIEHKFSSSIAPDVYENFERILF